MFLLIDNYDSFTYNLVQAFYALGHEPVVLRNDDPAILDMAVDPALEMVCISPGPGHPSQTGFCPGESAPDKKILWGRPGASLFAWGTQEKFFLFPEKEISLNGKEKRRITPAWNRDLPQGPPCHR